MITKFKIFEHAEDIKDWKIKLDISKIWNDSIFNDSNKLLSFNEQYIRFLFDKKNIIIEKTSEEAWNKLQGLITKLSEKKTNVEDSVTVWDDIYDWADGNMVEIITKTETTKTDF